MTNKVFEKPFALFMGPQRAGTTWIDEYCRYRGDICLPTDVKEIFFFDRHYTRGPEFYQSHFELTNNHALVAEVTTTSFDHADAPRHVREMFGDDVTLICPLRKPVRRSYSLYKHYLRYGLVSGNIMEACTQEPQIINSSRYVRHIERWLEFFPREQLNFIFQEDLEQNRDVFVRHLCDLLGVGYKAVPRELTSKINVSTASSNRRLAHVAQRMGMYLRDKRLYGVVNFAKTIGLKDWVFGRENPEGSMADISSAERDWLDEQLGGEVQRLEKLIGPIPAWKIK